MMPVISVKWIVIALVVAMTPIIALWALLPTHDPLEVLVRLVGTQGWAWLVGGWAGDRAAKEAEKR